MNKEEAEMYKNLLVEKIDEHFFLNDNLTLRELGKMKWNICKQIKEHFQDGKDRKV